MPISHGHRPYEYSEFTPELESDVLLGAVELKQNLYNEGAAKIQAHYDALSTLPLVRDADKAYMNQELNKVFSVIRDNAGSSDFSNPQTVKSFIDIAKPLERDPVIKNAVESSMEYHNRLKVLDDIRTNHPDKYNEANEWDYMNDVNDWANDPNPGSKLSSKYYNPYTDNSKAHAEMISKMQPQIDAYVNRLKVSGMHTIEEVKALKEGKIKEMLLQTMTPHQLKQLDMDARYRTSTMDVKEKYNTVIGVYQQMYKTAMSLSKAKGIENETGTTQQEYAQQAQIAQETLNSLQNPDGAINRSAVDNLYSKWYVSNWAEGMGKAYSYQQTKTKMQTDPVSSDARKNTYALQRMNKEFDMNMRLRGMIPQEGAPGGYVKGPMYEALNKSKAAKPTEAPAIFDKGVNNEYMKKLSDGKPVKFSGQAMVEANLDAGFLQRTSALLASLKDNNQEAYANFDAETGTIKETITGVEIDKVNGQLRYNVTVTDASGDSKSIKFFEQVLREQSAKYFGEQEGAEVDNNNTFKMSPQAIVPEEPVQEKTEQELEDEANAAYPQKP